MLKQMTEDEKERLDTLSFDELWLSVWEVHDCRININKKKMCPKTNFSL